MKINELLQTFTTALSNEESEVLNQMSKGDVTPIHAYTEREQFVIESLIRKALVSKVVKNGRILVMANETYKP